MEEYKRKRCGFCSGNHKYNYKKHIYRKFVYKPLLENIDIETLKLKFEDKILNNSPITQKYTNFTQTTSTNQVICVNSNTSSQNSNNSSISNKIQCEHCLKYYSRLDSLKRHYYTCKKKKGKDEKMLMLIKQKDEEIALMKEKQKLKDEEMTLIKKQVEILMKQAGSSNKQITNIEKQVNNTNIVENQVNNTNNINIVINGFGDENIEYITKEFYKGLFNGPFGAVQKLIKHIHFHSEHPENWNVKITNDKTNKALIYKPETKRWVKRDKKDTINSLVEKGYGILDDHFEIQKKKNELEDKVISKYTDFQKKYDSGDKQIEKKLEKDTREILVNYKEVVN